ncbi:MAG: DUF2802 domain-containing protein [Legionellaceae bacterium]|nr:DUF2802 domain-containing protein [Legionellaceae bacterium]
MIFMSIGTALIMVLWMVVVHMRSQMRQLQKQVQKDVKAVHEQLKMLQQENAALVSADLSFGRQIHEFCQQLISIEHQLQSLENSRGNDGAHQHALRILAMGGDKEEIIKNCHLSNAEAELIMNLHAYRVALS